MNRALTGIARQISRSGTSHHKQFILNGKGKCLLQTKPTHAHCLLVTTRQSSSGSGSGEQQGGRNDPDAGFKALLGYSAVILLGAAATRKKDDTPPSDPSLPEVVPYLIVGSGTTAINAAYGVRLQDPNAKVLILSDSDSLPYKEGALVRDMWLADDEDAEKFEWFSHMSKGKRHTNSIFHEKCNYFLDPEVLMESEHGGVALAKNRKVSRINTEKQYVVQKDGTCVKYEKLLLVSDSKSPRVDALAGLKDKVTYYEGIKDYIKLKTLAKQGAKIIVVGNTQQACDLAAGVAATNRSTTQVGIITPEKYLLSDTLPEHFAKVATKEYSNSTIIDVITNAPIIKSEINYRSGRVQLTLGTGEEIFCDHVVVASGNGANTSLGECAGMQVNSHVGAFSVNERYEAVPNVWMAGDGVAFTDPSLGLRTFVSNDQRVSSGRLAGSNMAGAKKAFQRQPTRQGDLGPSSFYVCLGNCSSKYKTITYFPRTDGPEGSEYEGPGIVFYTCGGLITGVLIWNMLGWRGVDGIDFARKILKSNLSADDIHEVVKEARLNTWDEFFAKMSKMEADKIREEQKVQEMAVEKK